jgi:glucokinase
VAGRRVVGKPNLLRMVNRNTILHLLEQQRVTSRAELATLSGLSPPTVSAVIRELTDEGWVSELGSGPSVGGKPPNMIGFNVDARVVAAVRITATSIETRISNLANEVLHTEIHEQTSYDSSQMSQVISRSILHMLHQARIPWDKILGVCVSVPGVVDLKGTVSNAPELGWEGVPLGEQLGALLDSDVLVQNDVKLATLGEAWARGFSKGTMVYLHLDRGIGAGILIDGQVYPGSHFAAGEIGSMIVSPDTLTNPPHDDKAGVTAGPFERNFGLEALLSKESAEDEQAREMRILSHIAYGVANVVSVLDPELIVLGGEMTSRIEGFIDKLTARVETLPIVKPSMVTSELGSDGCYSGATRYVLDNFREQVNLISI